MDLDFKVLSGHKKYVSEKLVSNKMVLDKNIWMIKKAYEFAEDLKNNRTASELRLMEALKNAGIVYKEQEVIFIPEYSDKFAIKEFYIGDFYLPKYKLIIEMDGNHHYLGDKFWKDYYRDRSITRVAKMCILRIENKYLDIFLSDMMGLIIKTKKPSKNAMGYRSILLPDGSLMKMKINRGHKYNESPDKKIAADKQKSKLKMFLKERELNNIDYVR